jgi:hypothetical protein
VLSSVSEVARGGLDRLRQLDLLAVQLTEVDYSVARVVALLLSRS